MSMTKILIAMLLSVVVVVVVQAEVSPVFLWGVKSPIRPALGTVMQEEFAELMEPLIKDRFVVAFLEENLSSEDFMCSNAESASCFAHLKGVSPKTYYNRVENPVAALRSVAEEHEFKSVDRFGKLSAPLTCGPGKVVFITFDGGRGERGASLEEHDDIISAVSGSIEGSVVFLYLSAPSTAATVERRVPRQTIAGQSCFSADNRFKICCSSILLKAGAGPKQVLKPSGVTVTNLTANPADSPKLSVALATDSTPLSFNISLDGGYFSMGPVVIGNESFHGFDVEAPTDFSFLCRSLTLRTMPTDKQPAKLLFLKYLQFQAPFDAKYKNDFAFGDSWNCVGFFSPGILMGLFVLAVLLLIYFSGLCWMMDINTMDRFEDPHGKDIVINAEY